MGVVGSVHKQQLLDHSDVPFSHPLPVLLRPDGSFQDTTTKYTFVDGDRPKLVSRYGSRVNAQTNGKDIEFVV